MKDGTSSGYSAAGAQASWALRQGPPAAVRTALLAARARTLRLAEDFRAALGPRPHLPYAQELNPPLWELGHIGWFQEWWLLRNPQRALGVRADPAALRFPSLMPQSDSWYDSSRVAHRRRWELPLPGAEATGAYLHDVLERTLELLDGLPATAGDDLLYFFRLAVAHEEMHAEAAVYMAQTLGIPVREMRGPLRAQGGEAIRVVPAGSFALGGSEAGFAFDNELGGHAVQLAAYVIDAEPVTWGDYLPFLEGGGYAQPRWWSPQGRAWLESLHRRQPAGLRRGPHGWEQLRHGAWHGVHPEELALHLSAHEAEAWCRWAGRRLPSEAEWECAALTQPGFRWGQVWEWTASTFQPYPAFTPHPYRDYSEPWFGSRRVLRGASFATAPSMAHPRYRNFFEPHRRDIFAGFRSVRTDDAPKGSRV